MRIPNKAKFIKRLDELKTKLREQGRGEELFTILNFIHFNTCHKTRLNVVEKLNILTKSLELVTDK